MLERFNPNPTMVAGVLSLTMAAVVCLLTSRRVQSSESRTWAVLATVNILLAIEVLVGLRHQLHDLANGELAAQGWYGQKLFVQQTLVATLGINFSRWCDIRFSARFSSCLDCGPRKRRHNGPYGTFRNRSCIAARDRPDFVYSIFWYSIHWVAVARRRRFNYARGDLALIQQPTSALPRPKSRLPIRHKCSGYRSLN